MCKLLLFVSWRSFYRSAITLIDWFFDGVAHIRSNSLHADVLVSIYSTQSQLAVPPMNDDDPEQHSRST